MSKGICKRKVIIKKGDKYNKLTAIKFDHMGNCQYWLFKCDCGNKKVICIGNVRNGHTRSCGCLQKEIAKKICENGRTHGMCKTSVYKSWTGLKDRCLNKNCKSYEDWGGRGITVCDRWLKFENFYKDMGECPKNKSIERIDNNKGYYKKNCKWATRKEQANNKRNNHLIMFKGKTKTIAQWAEELNINPGTLYSKVYRNNF